MGDENEGGRGAPACANAGNQTAFAGLDLRGLQIRPGTDVPHYWESLRNPDRGPALFQCVRPVSIALKSLYGRSRELRFSATERETSHHLRRWPAVARFRQRL